MITTVGKGMTQAKPALIAQETSPQAPREIPEQLTQMNAALDNLLEMVALLEDRLNPVLRPSSPQPENEVSKPMQVSRFGDVLQSFNSRIQSLTDHIADLERRTQL